MSKTTIPEWIKSISKHKMDDALTVIAAMAAQAKEDARSSGVPNAAGLAQANLRYYEGRRDALFDVLAEFERHTVMASAQKRRAKEPV